MLSLTKITRSEMGAYLCIASNGKINLFDVNWCINQLFFTGVPPSVSKRMKVQVHCE